MSRRTAIRTLAFLAGACLLSQALAQEKSRLKRIGFHNSASASTISGSIDSFRKGMAAHGWVEGRDYFIDARFADNRAELIESIAADLVAAKPDLLVAAGDNSTRALFRRTKTIPIVFAISSDPIGSGYASTLVRPGGNITGLTSLAPDLAAKRLQLLREVSPRLTHVGLLFNGSEAQARGQLKAYEEVAGKLNLRLSFLEVKQAEDIAPAIARAAELRAGALALTQGPFLNSSSAAIARAAVAARLPTIAPFNRDADEGMLMAYAPDILENFRLAAGYADRILKGAKPGELAIEQPSRFEFAVNARTAKAIGVKIPPSILVRADRIIE